MPSSPGSLLRHAGGGDLRPLCRRPPCAPTAPTWRSRSRCWPPSSSSRCPGRTRVERRRSAASRSKRREVRRIAGRRSAMSSSSCCRDRRERVQCTRHKVVRGITLKREELDRWPTGSRRSPTVSSQRRGRRAATASRSKGCCDEPAVSPRARRRSGRAGRRRGAARGRRALGAARRRVARADRSRAASPSPPPSGALRELRGTAGSRRLRSAGASFSSDLAVSEWSALCAARASTPITQVMGSSIYHVGWQPTYYNVPTEVDASLSRRLQRDAAGSRSGGCSRRRRRAGADAVVGVRDRRGRPRLGAPARSSSSRSAPPCACPRRCATPAGRPVLTDLSGQEFALLLRRGDRARSGSPPTPASTTSQPRRRRRPDARRVGGGLAAAEARGPTRSSSTSARASTKRARRRWATSPRRSPRSAATASIGVEICTSTAATPRASERRRCTSREDLDGHLPRDRHRRSARTPALAARSARHPALVTILSLS